MKTTQTLKFQNRHLVCQTTDEKLVNLQQSPLTQILSTFNERHQPCPLSRSSNESRTKQKYWNKTEERLYAQFWLQKFIQNPCQNFSLDAPLNRKSYNKQASDYIRNKSKNFESESDKTAEQCKSKFATIRRKLRRGRKQHNKEQFQLGFVDFIIQKAESLTPLQPSILEKIQKVRNLRQNQGPFVTITLQHYKFQKSHHFTQTFSLLSQYVQKKQKRQAHVYYQ